MAETKAAVTACRTTPPQQAEAGGHHRGEPGGEPAPLAGALASQASWRIRPASSPALARVRIASPDGDRAFAIRDGRLAAPSILEMPGSCLDTATIRITSPEGPVTCPICQPSPPPTAP